jgi:GNAT superfamily N-acetyltransferase
VVDGKMIRAIRSPDVMWYVEYWDDDNDSDFPLATAYVWEYQDGNKRKAELSFILTADQERRKGIATQLLSECEKRWPSIRMTEPISEAGRLLRDSRKGKDSGYEEN